MPSSPGPTDYKRTLQRFFYRGMQLLPQDALAEGKHAYAKNVRGYMNGTVGPRYGLNQLTDDPPPFTNAHSLFRLNDTTPYADVGAPERRFIGDGTVLQGGSPGVGTFGTVDLGPYSGNPLTGVDAHPRNSPRPFFYLGDSLRSRKVNSSFNDMPIGLAQPLVPPSAALAAPELTFLNSVGTAAWTSYGPNAAPGAPTPAPTGDRVNTTLTNVLFDTTFPGMASLALADFNNVTAGMTLDIGASPETVVVHSVHPPVAPTTIESILYDSGNTGMCSIQPTGSFSVGQIEAPLPIEIERRYKDLNEPLPPRVTITRTVDFPVDSLILLGGVEVVRIQSVAVGPDGVLSFRCFTFGTFAATDTISGIASFRAYCNTAKSPGDAVTSLALQITVTPASTTTAEVGGVQAPILAGPRNWAQVGTRATAPEDIIRFGIKVDLLSFVQSVRLVLDLSPVGPEFLRDYLFFEWRASDLVEAIQSASEATAGLVADSQEDAVQRGAATDLYQDQYGQVIRQAIVESRGDRAFHSILGGTHDPDSSQTNVAETGNVSTGSGISRQLSLGNDIWMTLECRVGDLTRVGTDTTLTLQAIQNVAIYAQFLGTTSTVNFQVTDPYLVGGYGPDVGTILPPYVYRYSYRATSTGERSNPSPPMRAGMTPRRGRVLVSVTPSQDPQCDVIDLWRFGGALARWEYVLTEPNETVSPSIIEIADDMSDKQIDGGERIRTDLYQPWPVADLPRSGTCNVAGTSIEWVSGDQFDPLWAADSLILIDGRATQLYRSPTSATRLEVVDNCGSGTAVAFSLPSPTILSQPLPYLWGGSLNNVWIHFACGDPSNPGVLHWSHGNDPDATSDRNTLTVTSASEPLMNGFFDDGIPYVFSTERLHRILPTFADPLSAFRTDETNCTRGLWSPWGLAVDPSGGAYFIGKEGIYFTRGGSEAVSITDADLRVLFPHDGIPNPEPIRNLYPIDFSLTTRLRLALVGRLLYFDYVDTRGEGHTFVYDTIDQSWTPDAYLEQGSPPIPIGAIVRLAEPGPQVETHILTAEDGHLYQYDLTKLTDVLTPVCWEVWTPWAHGDDPRAWKQWGDAILDMHPGGSVNGIQVTPCITNGNVLLESWLLGQGGLFRDTFLIEVNQGAGQYSRNFGLLIQSCVDACDTQRPLLYLWEPSFIHKNVSVGRRATDWEDLGYKGAKFVQGVVIRANTFGVPKLLQVEYDGPANAPQVAMQLSIFHDGEQAIAYPQQDTGWNPFVAELVRLRGIDDLEWTLLDWRFVWEPAPELATQWETQDTTFDLPGFLSVRDGVMAYESEEAIELTVWHDLNPTVHTLPATGGEYQRIYVPFAVNKGKAVRFQWYSELAFRLYKRDCSVRIQGWGLPGGYMVVNPFGGPHRIDGAGI